MRIEWLGLTSLSLALALVAGCDRDNADPRVVSGTGGEAASSSETAPTPTPAQAPQPAGCEALRITVDGEPMTVGSVHAYTGVSASGDVYGQFVRASEAADETCAEILANTGVTRDGQSVRYVTAFASPESDLYHTLMLTGWSQTGVSLEYTENPDDTRTICVVEEVAFTGPGDLAYTVVGELTGPHCGDMEM